MSLECDVLGVPFGDHRNQKSLPSAPTLPFPGRTAHVATPFQRALQNTLLLAVMALALECTDVYEAAPFSALYSGIAEQGACKRKKVVR